MRQTNLRSLRLRDVAAHSPVIRFGMARFCPTCDLLHTGDVCPKCDGQVSVDLREMMTAQDRQPTHASAGRLIYDISRACGDH
jgi:hypothetical protein